ncbi:VanZ family protein [Acidobacteriota bacterium]
MHNFVKYKLPPLICMILIFPLTNRYLSGPWIYSRIGQLFRLFDPNVTLAAIGTGYTVFRKSCHFVEYAVLAYLLYRMFRAGNLTGTNVRWVLHAAFISIGYGFMDEFVQIFIPNRNGSIFDVLIDIAGILTVLSFMMIRSSRHREAVGT